MRSRSRSALTLGRSSFVAITALAAVAALLAGPQPALAATPLTGEVLTGTGTSTGGSAYPPALPKCSSLFVDASAGFSASGTATGPYPGSFSETGNSSTKSPIDGSGGSLRFFHSVGGAFTITSGSTTIVGSFSGGQFAGLSDLICDKKGNVLGFHQSGIAVSYTATIDGQTVQGTGTVSGTFYIAPGAQDSVIVSLN